MPMAAATRLCTGWIIIMAPKAVAAPLPPRTIKRSLPSLIEAVSTVANSDQLCPTTTLVAEMDVATPICSANMMSRASQTAKTPFETSTKPVKIAQPLPTARATLVPPILPLPTSKILTFLALPTK